MGLFGSKEVCPVCGKRIRGDVLVKIKDNVPLCRECSAMVNMDAALIPLQSAEDMKRHLAYRERNLEKYERFHTTLEAKAGLSLLCVDEVQMLWYCIRNRREKNPPLFDYGEILLSTDAIHTVKPLEAVFPKNRLTVITGVSGSGKTTLILESLVPALEALTNGKRMPEHVVSIEAEGIWHVKLIDATPIGINVRSTVATYSGVHDELRKLFARTDDARRLGYKAGDFSYNTGKLRCPVCDGTGTISLDVQFLPDVDIPCTECRGSRYSKDAYDIRYAGHSLPELMDMDINDAATVLCNVRSIKDRLAILQELGLGYLTLGEETPGLSGGEAQRLKLASEMGRSQSDSLFVFDEPTIGLHPDDVKCLLGVFQSLLDHGATVVVIEHDLDVIRSADYIIDMGPGGGDAGGRIVASGTPDVIRKNRESITARYI